MIVGVVKETYHGERRVALVPASVPTLLKTVGEVLFEAGAGDEAGLPDREYEEKGARIVSDRDEVFAKADVMCLIRTYGANTTDPSRDLERYRPEQTLIGLAEPLTAREPIEKMAATGARVFALELIPRITRAQTMDVLSSQALVAGYKAVAIAVDTLPKMFPMMMTAAGTIAPAKVFVLGAGVAGLQAIAAARKAGAIVSAFDVRSEVKEQIESLGAKFIEIEVAEASGEGGYARELTAEERRQQQELMAETIAQSDVVITTAAVPGKKAPMLVSADVARRMHPGSVIVDMAAERGGNCELTRADEVVVENGVTILGPTNLAARIPAHASQMFAKNITNLLGLLVSDGALTLNREDEVVTGTMLTEGGAIVHARAREILGLEPLPEQAGSEEAVAEGSSPT